MPMRNLSDVPTVELQRELNRRAALRHEFEARRRRVAAEIARLDAEIAAITAESSRIGLQGKRHRRRRLPRAWSRSNAAATRATNEMTLTEALTRVLSGKTMRISEVVRAVQAAGYQSRAGDFRTVVNLTLLRRKDLFKRQGRGKYTSRLAPDRSK